MLDFLFELVFEIIFEGSIEIGKNRKISKWIRYPLIILVTSFILGIILLLLYLGIKSLSDNIFVGLFLISFSFIFLYFGYKKYKEYYLSRNNVEELFAEDE